MEFEMIRRIIAQVLDVDEYSITMSNDFTEDLGADSIDLFQIFIGLEEELDLEVDTAKAEQVKTVGDAVGLIRSTIGGQ